MKPRCVSIFPTNHCNAHCYYCAYQTSYAFADATTMCRKTDQLSRELLAKALDEAKICNNIEISGGGEPLCHPDFAWFAREVVARGIGAKLITNGVLLTGELLEVSAQLSYVEFSINYYDHLSFEANRSMPRGWFETVTANVRNLMSSPHSCVIGAKVVLTGRNYQTLPQIKQYLGSLGIHRLVVTPSYSRDASDVPPPAVFGMDRIAHVKPKCAYCQRRIDHPVIGADGKYYACCYFTYMPSMQIGDLATQSLSNVLDNGPVFDQGLCCRVEQVIADYRRGVVTAFP
jgi:MoaA/NifB/PqqE/SkfB family radical SAM enzyme